MVVPGYENFLEQCEEQEVTLHPALTEDTHPAEVEARFEYTCHTPSRMLQAIAMAGGLLRENPDQRLADRTIDLGSKVPGKLARSEAAQALAGIINGSIERLDAESGITDLPGSNYGIDACRAAEYRFAQAIFALEAGSGECQIIGDEEPALLRKFGMGSKSALSLRPLGVDGVPYPAGSIFRVTLDPGVEPRRDIEGVQSVGLEDVRSLGFMRLSAYGLGLRERMANFTDVYEGWMDSHVAQVENNIIKSTKIQDIEQIARAAYTASAGLMSRMLTS
jgi:hypothetical protein